MHRYFGIGAALVIALSPLSVHAQEREKVPSNYLNTHNLSDDYAHVTVQDHSGGFQTAFQLAPKAWRSMMNSNCLLFSCSVRFQFMKGNTVLCDTKAKGWFRGTAVGRYDPVSRRCYIE
jgi:hypothetical protein